MMNEDQSIQEKDFRSLINQFTVFSQTRDKMIYEIDDILDRIKQNRQPSNQPPSPIKADSPMVNPPVISQLRDLLREMDLSNERIQTVICRLNELV